LATSDERHDEFRDGFPFVGGRPWLDLLNTVVSDGAESRDLMEAPEAAGRWLSAAAVDGARAVGNASSQLTALREALRPAVELLRERKPLPPALIARMNDLLEQVSLRSRLIVEGGVPHLVSWIDPGSTGAAGIVADDFARFVCEAEPERLKHCANPACSLVFYDSGKNNARRWCSMSVCGNRDKVARYRARRRSPVND
jgi:predicted RNA-binding Zn ribbon-like protein